MDPKEVLAQYSIKYVKDTNIIGLGTGKTIRKLIEVMSKHDDLKKDKLFVASSIDTEMELSKNNFNVITLFSGIRPQVYIDSFDAITQDGILIKGGGGALLREKLLSYFSQKRIFIGDSSKMKRNKLYEVPVEVVSVSVNYVMRSLEDNGYAVRYREGSGKIGPIISDNGNVILDVVVKAEELCKFNEISKKIPGIVETGVFCKDLYDKVIIADENGRIEEIMRGTGFEPA